MRKIEEQIGSYLEWCEKVKLLTPSTIRIKKEILGDFLNCTDVGSIEEISNSEIEKWMRAQLTRGCSGRTVNKRMGHLNAMMHYFERKEIESPNFKRRLIDKCKEGPLRRDFYTKEQIDKVLLVTDLRGWLCIKLSFDCGFRIAELRKLRLQDIDGRMIRFVGKGNKAREAYMSPETREKLDIYIETEHITDWLWPSNYSNSRDGVVTVSALRRDMALFFKKAGFDNFYPHALRHSFATDICQKGASIEIAREMLGHAKIETTQRYVHSLSGRLCEYFDRYKFTDDDRNSRPAWLN